MCARETGGLGAPKILRPRFLKKKGIQTGGKRQGTRAKRTRNKLRRRGHAEGLQRGTKAAEREVNKFPGTPKRKLGKMGKKKRNFLPGGYCERGVSEMSPGLGKENGEIGKNKKEKRNQRGEKVPKKKIPLKE